MKEINYVMCHINVLRLLYETIFKVFKANVTFVNY